MRPRPGHAERETDPIAKRGVTLDRGGGLCRIGDRTAAAALDKGRVRHDVIEAAGAEARRRLQQITDHDREPVGHPVEQQIVAGEPHEIALQLDPDDTALRHRAAEPARRAGASPHRGSAGGGAAGSRRETPGRRGARASAGWRRRTPAEQAILAPQCRYPTADGGSPACRRMGRASPREPGPPL
jgi:hypothetical protein